MDIDVPALSRAEFRILPLLQTYLSFQEMGDRLGVSRNTVKTHVVSIYEKLSVSSRAEAVERAIDLGLLDLHPVLDRFPAPRPDPAGQDGG